MQLTLPREDTFPAKTERYYLIKPIVRDSPAGASLPRVARGGVPAASSPQGLPCRADNQSKNLRWIALTAASASSALLSTEILISEVLIMRILI